jgi:hypothetical protein
LTRQKIIKKKIILQNKKKPERLAVCSTASNRSLRYRYAYLDTL